MKRLIATTLTCLCSIACFGDGPIKGEGEISSKIIDNPKVYCGSSSEEAWRLYAKGERLDASGNLTSAKEAYISAINADPGFCDAIDNLGLIYRREGDINTAIEHYLRSLSLAPTNIVAIENLGAAYDFQGKFEEAAAQYEKLIAVDENNPEGHYGLGRQKYLMGQYENAIKDLFKAAELYRQIESPYTVDAYVLLGFSFFNLEQCDAAIDYFIRSYSSNSDNANVNYCLGICLYSSPIREIKMSSKQYLNKAAELGVQLPDEISAFLTSPP